MNTSEDGRYLVLTGYDAAPGTTSVASSASATVNRVVALVGADGSINTTTALTDTATGNNIRSADSVDGTSVWVAGAGGDVRFALTGSTTSTQLSTTAANIRDVEIFNGQLYVSDSSGSAVRLGAVGAGEPTTSGQTIVNLPGLSSSTGSPYEFFMADLSPAVAGFDTLYVSDDSAGLVKYTFNGSTWSASGTVGSGSDPLRGLAAQVDSSGNVTLFASSGGNKVVSITDSSGYGGIFSGSLKTIATAAANETFRGVALAPVVTDTNPPTMVSLNPDDDAVNISASANLVLSFSESVKLGGGAIAIRLDSDDSVVQTIDVASGAVTVSGNVVTIKPPTDIAQGTAYHVEIPAGAITDIAGNAYAGIASADAYHFATAVSETQTLSFASTAISQAEGNSGGANFTFTVQRAGGVTGDASFTVNFDQGSTEAADYSGGVLPASTLSGTIAAGQTSATITIPVADDTTEEPNESFTLTLAGTPTDTVSGVTIGLAASNLVATGTITEDDSATYTPIYTIQGSGAASPYAGQTVTTRGVVTAATPMAAKAAGASTSRTRRATAIAPRRTPFSSIWRAERCRPSCISSASPARFRNTPRAAPISTPRR